MAHKTLVGATAYEISGGKTLVNGTAYSIKNGKTLVGGTEYEVGFSQMPKITLNIESGPAWIEINGEYYESDGTYELEVESGTVLTCVYQNTSSPRWWQIRVNGTVVKSDYPGAGSKQTYDYTITTDTTVELTVPGDGQAVIYITEE